MKHTRVRMRVSAQVYVSGIIKQKTVWDQKGLFRGRSGKAFEQNANERRVRELKVESERR